MDKLQRQDDVLAQDQRLLRSQIMSEIADDLRMLFAGTETFGRVVDGLTLATWATAFACAGIFPREFAVAVEHWITNIGGKTPTPAEVIGWIRDGREALRIEEMNRRRAEERRVNEEAERKRNLEVYGTETPSSDQVRDHIKSQGYRRAWDVESTEENSASGMRSIRRAVKGILPRFDVDSEKRREVEAELEARKGLSSRRSPARMARPCGEDSGANHC